ncbi:MAG: hypothetical protein A2297_05075 [Elusimicrobia bacterium RIFOXYB2_FULL_48_7]|nr:MAG: hypothetical protein A2297_05075 [Elusimicrobia bacterium RIFOXYB2_FULL_48_7]
MKKILIAVLASVLAGFLAGGCVSTDLAKEYENSLLISQYEKIRSNNSLDNRNKLLKCASCRQ